MSQHFRSHSTENFQLDLIRMLINWAEIPDDPHGPDMRNMLAAAEGVIQALREKLASGYGAVPGPRLGYALFSTSLRS